MKYPTKHTVVFENSYYRILCFKPSVFGEVDTVLLGAIAGHTSQFTLDFDTDKSLAQCGVENCSGGVYGICIKPPTMFNKWIVTYSSWMQWVADTINFIGDKPVHLVGVCQGGVLATKVTTKYPELVCELTVVAAPIDTSFESIITPAQKIPFVVYQMAVAGFGGVMCGDAMLKAWKKPNAEKHKLGEKDPKKAHFYKCYNETQSITGIAYLEMIYNVFCNIIWLHTYKVDCKLNLVMGLKDDITPPAQTEALEHACSNTVSKRYVSGGHMGTFGSREAMKEDGVFAQIFKGEMV